MPTPRVVDEIADLAQILLSEYRTGTPLHDLSQQQESDDQPDDGTTFVVEVAAAGNQLSGLVATLDAIELAVEAATVAVLYDGVFPDRTSDELDGDLLRRIASEPVVSLQIIYLANGSFRGAFRAVFGNAVPRNSIAAVATLSGIALHVMFPPLLVPTAILGGVGPVIGVVGALYDRRAKQQAQIKSEAMERELARLREANAENAAKLEELSSQLNRIEHRYDAKTRRAPVVDAAAVRNADIQSIEIRPERPPQAA